MKDDTELNEIEEINEVDQTVDNEDDSVESVQQRDDQEQDTFDRPYVEKLRKESAGYRDRAKTAESRVKDLVSRLHHALVENDGRLADPNDLEMKDEYFENTQALTDEITELLERKPGLRSRKIMGDAGQGKRGDSANVPNLIDLIRNS